MKLLGQEPLYSGKKIFKVSFFPSICEEKKFINFTGRSMNELKYKLLETLIKFIKVPVVTSCDFLRYEKYIKLLKRFDLKVIMYTGNCNETSLNKRIDCVETLRERGIRVVCFDTEDEFNELHLNDFPVTPTTDNIGQLGVS